MRIRSTQVTFYAECDKIHPRHLRKNNKRPKLTNRKTFAKSFDFRFIFEIFFFQSTKYTYNTLRIKCWIWSWFFDRYSIFWGFMRSRIYIAMPIRCSDYAATHKMLLNCVYFDEIDFVQKWEIVDDQWWCCNFIGTFPTSRCMHIFKHSSTLLICSHG